MTKRLLATTALAVAAMLAFLVPAATAQQYQPTGSLVLPPTAHAGDTVTASGTGCPPGSTVTLTFDDPAVSLGSTTADSTGAFSLQITIPAGANPGTHTVTATCGDVTLSSTITILAPAGGGGGGGGAGGPISGGTLPRTGTNSTIPMTQIGLGLLAIGGVLLVVARKKRHSLAI